MASDKQPSGAQESDATRDAEPVRDQERRRHRRTCSAVRSRLALLAQIGEDWLYLALLGTIMALLSFFMDSIITLFLSTRLWLFEDLAEDNLYLQFVGWSAMPIVLVSFSSAFVHLCSPTAIGSGIPEMKTILRGVILNEYLTFRTLVAKIVGLTFTLGSGLPLGKEGPFVHMASIVATLLSKLVASFQGIYENESRTSEMLSAACAVGVAATFYAPIGGVLFSIEVTTVYFAVRNYWRGFFAACCGATIWRLLGFWIKNDESISALFKTNFRTDYPFDPIELLMFSFIGASCGLIGAAYIKFHREIVQFFRRHKRMSAFLQKHRFIYPILVTLIITSVTFPPLLGKYTASTLSTHTTIEQLFSNRTWSLGGQDLVSQEILDHWTTPETDFHVHLFLYIVVLFWTSALASTIPIPSGLFIPVLKMGAAYGRLIGELMHSRFPDGIKWGDYAHPSSIVPGSYAVVGAAAFSGAVTHTISTSVILFEMTGQIVHIIPVILGVLIANAVCQSLQPSIYDSIIEIKKLPYLPPIASSNSISHKILVKDFMNTNLAYVSKEKCTYAHVRSLLANNKKIISFPLVESPLTMKLLGSVSRPDLLKLLYLHLGRERRLQEVCRRNSDTLAPALHMLNTTIHHIVQEQQQSEWDESAAKVASGEKTDLPARSSATNLRNKQNVDDNDGDDGDKNSPMNNDDNDSGILYLKSDIKVAASPLSSRKETTADDHSDSSSSAISIEVSNIHSASPSPHLARKESVKLIIKTSDVNDKNLMMLVDMDARKSGDNLSISSEISTATSAATNTNDGSNARPAAKCIARIINRYNLGSSMDDEQLDRSRKEVKSQLAAAAETPEVVIDLALGEPVASIPELESTESTVAGSAVAHLKAQLMRMSGESNSLPPPPPPARSSVMGARPLTPVMESNASASTFSLPQYPQGSPRPTKSILKTSNSNSTGLYKKSLTSQSFSGMLSLPVGANDSDSAWRQQQQRQFNHGSLKPQSSFTSIASDQSRRGEHADFGNRFPVGGKQRASLPLDDGRRPEERTPVRQRRKVRLPRLRVVDMTPEEQRQWEKDQLNAYVDVSKCRIDEAPFQLVEQTSLYRVHTLFSMLGLNHAYVTSFGQLVGIVALKDIRYALEKMMQDK